MLIAYVFRLALFHGSFYVAYKQLQNTEPFFSRECTNMKLGNVLSICVLLLGAMNIIWVFKGSVCYDFFEQ